MVSIVLSFDREFKCRNSSNSSQQRHIGALTYLPLHKTCTWSRGTHNATHYRPTVFKVSDETILVCQHRKIWKKVGEKTVYKFWEKASKFLGLSEYYVISITAEKCKLICLTGWMAIGWSKLTAVGWFACKYLYAEAITWLSKGAKPVLNWSLPSVGHWWLQDCSHTAGTPELLWTQPRPVYLSAAAGVKCNQWVKDSHTHECTNERTIKHTHAHKQEHECVNSCTCIIHSHK